MFMGSKARPALKAANFTAIWDPIVRNIWILDVIHPYRPPMLVTGARLPTSPPSGTRLSTKLGSSTSYIPIGLQGSLQA
jgi:hypothetical protein